MEYRRITKENRNQINRFIAEQWISTEMVIRGKIVDMTTVDGLVVYDDYKIVALLTYIVDGDSCEITSLDSLMEGQGIGSSLIDRMLRIAEEYHCTRIRVITTNDNIHALRFYQKRGFELVCIYRNALDISRQLKPQIPLIGENDIPLRHEIELEYVL